jgi:hypothetical protein
MWSCRPSTQCWPVTTAAGTPDKSRFARHGADAWGERQCRSRSEHCRASMRTSGTGNGAMPDCLVAPCIRRAAARLLVMAVTPGWHHGAYGLLGGTALRDTERSACCLTSSLSGCLAYSSRSTTASRWPASRSGLRAASARPWCPRFAPSRTYRAAPWPLREAQLRCVGRGERSSAYGSTFMLARPVCRKNMAEW